MTRLCCFQGDEKNEKRDLELHLNVCKDYGSKLVTKEGFLRKNIVAVSFFQNCAIHPYS